MDTYTKWSSLLLPRHAPGLTAEERKWWEEEFGQDEAEEYSGEFELVEHDDGGCNIKLTESESGDLIGLTEYVRRFIQTHRPGMLWTMTWACTCSSPEVGEFSGGAVAVTADGIEWSSAVEWEESKKQEHATRRHAALKALADCDLSDSARAELDRYEHARLRERLAEDDA